MGSPVNSRKHMGNSLSNQKNIGSLGSKGGTKNYHVIFGAYFIMTFWYPGTFTTNRDVLLLRNRNVWQTCSPTPHDQLAVACWNGGFKKKHMRCIRFKSDSESLRYSWFFTVCQPGPCTSQGFATTTES